MDLYQEIEKLMTQLTDSINKLKRNGDILALAERDYRIALSQEALKLKTDKIPVTLINQVIGGIDSVAESRFKRDLAQSNYDVNKEAINVMKLKIRILESQLSREWSLAGKKTL